jgi:cytochrome b561
MATVYYAVWLKFDARRQNASAFALQAVLAILVVSVGILGVSSDSALRRLAGDWVNIHALFGLILCGLVISRFRWRLKHHRPVRPAELRELTRHLSRIVYLSLYLVIGAKQLMAVVNSSWRGNDLGGGHIAAACTSANCSVIGSTKDFQAILLYGIVMLVLIRALTFSFSLRGLPNFPDAGPPQPILHDLK